jgi:hypothetical protein
VRPLTLWRHEVRRAGLAALLGPPAAAALGVVLVLADPVSASDAGTAHNLVAVLEIAVPLAAGVGCASLVGNDPATEVQLSVPTPYRVTLARRLTVTLGWAAVVSILLAASLVTTGWWDRWPDNHGAVGGQLVWLAPSLGLGAVGFATGALSRSPAVAGAAVTSLWLLQLILAGPAQAHRPGRLLYLFATTQGTTPGDWTANRLTLIGVSAVLVALALVVLGRSERLIGGEDA